MNRVQLSPEYFPESAIGRPVAGGSIYVGTPDLDPEITANQKTLNVQQEDGTIVAVSQPVTTSSGGVPLYLGSPVTLLVEGNYSLKVLDSLGAQVYYVPSIAYDMPTGWTKLSDYDDLADAIATIGSTATDLWIDVSETLSASATTHKNTNIRTINGAILSDGGGAIDLTFNGPLEAGNSQVFDWTGTGIITFGDGSITEMLAGWFGDIDRTGTSDNTTALQQAINCAARSKVALLNVGSGHIKFTKLYFYYDVTNNSGWPQTAGYEGKITVVGVGRMPTYNVSNNIQVNTVLESTDATGPAFDINGDSVGHRLTDLKLRKMTVIASNTTHVIDMYKVNNMVSLEEMTVEQEGAGGGIIVEDTWVNSWRDVFIYGAGKATSDVGLVVRTIDTGGGNTWFENVNTKNFSTGWEIGHDTDGSGGTLQTVNCYNCQASTSKIGVIVGSGAKVTNWISSYIEQAEDSGSGIGMQIKNGAQVTNINGSWFGTNADTSLMIGDVAGGSPSYYRNVNVIGSKFIGVGTTGIKVYTTADSFNISIKGSQFNPATNGVGTGIDLPAAAMHGLVVENNYFPATGNQFATNISNEDRIGFYVEEDVITINGVGTGALAEEILQVYQRSTTGAYPPLYLKQGDNDEGFINFDSGITPGANYNHISTIPGDGAVIGPAAKAAANGWAYYGMLKIQVKGTDYWVPLFTADAL